MLPAAYTSCCLLAAVAFVMELFELLIVADDRDYFIANLVVRTYCLRIEYSYNIYPRVLETNLARGGISLRRTYGTYSSMYVRTTAVCFYFYCDTIHHPLIKLCA